METRYWGTGNKLATYILPSSTSTDGRLLRGEVLAILAAIRARLDLPELSEHIVCFRYLELSTQIAPVSQLPSFQAMLPCIVLTWLLTQCPTSQYKKLYCDFLELLDYHPA